MGKGEISRKRILDEAFRLFASRPYEQVSFSLMEKEIGISRGSMIYYFKNKEGLFREVLNSYIFDMSSVHAVPQAYRLSLCSFYTYYLELLRRERAKFAAVGIENLNEALFRIESSALTHFKNFKEVTQQWYDDQLQVWQTVIEHAIAAGEIKTNLKPSIIRYMFSDCYIGRCFLGVFTRSGCDIDLLEEIFNSIYATLRPTADIITQSSVGSRESQWES